jgi:acetyl/propionyl-CoA carboxylase alpha subunit
LCDKIGILEAVDGLHIAAVRHSSSYFTECELSQLKDEADQIGYPVIVKSCRGGRGRGEMLVRKPERLQDAVRRAQAEAQAVYGDRSVYLERAVIGARQIGVQVAGDAFGNLIHFGEREGSVLFGNQKIVEESPANGLNEATRERLFETAVTLAQAVDYRNIGTIEFLIDMEGRFYFTEIKPRIQMDHALTEMRARVDLIRMQIEIAMGQPLAMLQSDVHLNGHAILCRLTCEDPQRAFLVRPGKIQSIRLPTGREVRVDTYVSSGCDVPDRYDAMVAKLGAWAAERPTAIRRISAALEEIQITGIQTNIPLIKEILCAPDFLSGGYNSQMPVWPGKNCETSDQHLRDLAALAAILHLQRNRGGQPTAPERIQSGWHRNSRRLPE